VAAIFPDRAVEGETTGPRGVENGQSASISMTPPFANSPDTFSQSPLSAMVEPEALSAIV